MPLKRSAVRHLLSSARVTTRKSMTWLGAYVYPKSLSMLAVSGASAVGFAGSSGSSRATQEGFQLLAMFLPYLVNDTWPLPCSFRSTTLRPCNPKPETQSFKFANPVCGFVVFAIVRFICQLPGMAIRQKNPSQATSPARGTL